ncbi:Properdin [Merluccius polli]|uniref:Properdin n=1 Tax=Merluccius polli TaxID=89951 RepID=A0AA47PCI0_MERPO|nr:Properdin [Merluccius polli]
MRRLQSGVLLLGFFLLAQAEGQRCFSHFNLVSGACEGEQYSVEEDDCCLNPHYGFIDNEGVCQYSTQCGRPGLHGPSVRSCAMWGVVLRTRKCHGLSDCPGVLQDTVQMKPCNSTACCSAAEWLAWGPWTPCSASCGGATGERRRERVCSHPTPGCELTCVGPKDETELCVQMRPCPGAVQIKVLWLYVSCSVVHGGWTKWSSWTPCFARCIPGPFSGGSGPFPTKRRYRSCTSPAPSKETSPAGNDCQGPTEEAGNCSELPNCPVNGNWGDWGPFGPCSSSCGEGLQLSIRLCNNPATQYGGEDCNGTSTKSAICGSLCPVHGVWTGWSAWGDCSASCHSSRASSVRTRLRSCSNPAPSAHPHAKQCPGASRDEKKCDEIPNCPVDGVWGQWGPYSGCSVTCGVGFIRSTRSCDRPAPQHGGKPCDGNASRTQECNTRTHCPVDGVWSEWSVWSSCTEDGTALKNCNDMEGTQRRRQYCVQRDFGGAPCSLAPVSEVRACYDITNCQLPGLGWSGWSEWSLCESYNNKVTSTREMICEPDLSGYR